MAGSKRNRRIVAAACLLIATVVAAWLVYSYLYRIPNGPALPPALPEKQFSERIVELNNRAVEIQSQDSEEALRLYNDAVKADPEYWLGYVNKAQLLLRDKKYAEAASCFETLSALRPRAAEYYVGHAFCLHRLGKESRVRNRLLHAISAYNYRMETEASPFHARLNRAMILFLMGREYVARSELDRLAGQNAAYDQMVSALRDAMEKAKSKDRWSILGLDD